MPTRSEAPLRLASLLCAIVLAAAVAACGDKNDDDTNDGSGPTASQDGSARATNGSDTTAAGDAAGGSDADLIKASIAASREAFKTGDGQAICDGLTAAGQKDMVKYGSVIGIAGDCTKVAEGVTAYNKKAKLAQRPTKIVAVRVRGDSATAILRVQGSGALRQGFKKIDGQWKQLSYGLATYVGAQ